jgi:hypothetical protein
MVQVVLGKKQDPISKITRAKRAGGRPKQQKAQSPEFNHLPSKRKSSPFSVSSPALSKAFCLSLLKN